MGSGHVGTPRERMHWLKLRMPLSSCCTWLATPLERMQREKARSCEFTDPPGCDVPAELADDGLEPHAASSAVTATAVQ
jgi:hypothetical protein